MSEADSEQEEVLPPCTVPSCPLNFRHFSDNEEWGQRFIQNFQEVLFTCGRYMDLSLLDGVTVGFDYDDALASVDLGYESAIAKQYTNEGGLVGVAKMLRVMREGEIRAHVVANANVLVGLADLDDEFYWPSVSIVAHELAHVAVLGWFQAHSPGLLLAAYQGDWAIAMLRDVAHTIWEEYAACRLSAPFSSGDVVLNGYVDGSELAVADAMSNAREAIKAYRLHGDVNRLLVETTRLVGNPLKMAAYLMGHTDGRHEEFDADERLPVASGSEFRDLLPSLLTALRAAWNERLNWNGFEGVDGIVRVIQDALATAGAIVTLQQTSPGSRVDLKYVK